LRFTAFTDKERAGINTFVCSVSPYGAETPKASIKDYVVSAISMAPGSICLHILSLTNNEARKSLEIERKLLDSRKSLKE